MCGTVLDGNQCAALSHKAAALSPETSSLTASCSHQMIPPPINPHTRAGISLPAITVPVEPVPLHPPGTPR
jgi:hypothetical protein